MRVSCFGARWLDRWTRLQSEMVHNFRITSEFRMANGQTIRTIAREPDVRQDRAFPENGTAVIRG
jgi:hypothetical protein